MYLIIARLEFKLNNTSKLTYFVNVYISVEILLITQRKGWTNYNLLTSKAVGTDTSKNEFVCSISRKSLFFFRLCQLLFTYPHTHTHTRERAHAHTEAHAFIQRPDNTFRTLWKKYFKVVTSAKNFWDCKYVVEEWKSTTSVIIFSSSALMILLFCDFCENLRDNIFRTW